MTWSIPGYVELKELGRGASGRVVLAEHEATGTKVAIKYLADHLCQDPTFVEAFRAEAAILSEVENPQIARLYEYLESQDGSAIVMELVDGVALRAILREHGPTEPQSALVVLKGSLLGLAAAHEHGIVHRDYKPENVLVNQEGQSKLADFGIAARTGLKGAHAGTPSYMAPEQWAGSVATPSTDIYAATATFFECLTGHPPYRAPGDILALRGKHEEAPIPVDDVPEAIRGLVRRGLAKKPDHRPKDAATFLVELESVAGAGYGPDWEEEGRGALARRAALLLLLFPLAGAAAGGTGVAQTILGWSKKSFNLVLAGGLAVVLGAGGFVWYQSAQNNQTLPPVVVESPSTSPSPSLSPTLSPTPSPSPSANPSPSASPSNSPSPKPSKSKSPSPKPMILKWAAPLQGKNDFCWAGLRTTCSAYPVADNDQYLARVRLAFTTSTEAGFKLRLQFTEVYTGRVGETPQGSTPIEKTIDVEPSGVDYDITHTFDLTEFVINECFGKAAQPRIRLTIEASIPGQSPEPVYIVDKICAPPVE